MYIVCSFTSGYFLFYDEYVRVHYDDDDLLHDTRGFVVPLDIQLQSTSLTMQVQEVCEPAWWAQVCMCGSWVRKYHIQFVHTRDHLYDGFK